MIIALSFEEISGKLLLVFKRESPESSSLPKLAKAVSGSSCSSALATSSGAVTEGGCGAGAADGTRLSGTLGVRLGSDGEPRLLAEAALPLGNRP